MYKISQKEILSEGFLDNIRKITSPIAKTIAGAAGAAKGIAKVVAPRLSGEIGSDIDKLKSIGRNKSVTNKKEVKKRKGIPVKRIRRQRPKDNATQPVVEDKPKFYESLRAWKIKNIGPSAEKVGLTYQQLKQFLQSINVQDPDRVLKNAGAKDSGAGVVSNITLGNIESTLKGRGIVAEKAQINLIKQLNLLNDSYNKKYELPKH
jgi:hypothetical protein